MILFQETVLIFSGWITSLRDSFPNAKKMTQSAKFLSNNIFVKIGRVRALAGFFQFPGDFVRCWIILIKNTILQYIRFISQKMEFHPPKMVQTLLQSWMILGEPIIWKPISDKCIDRVQKIKNLFRIFINICVADSLADAMFHITWVRSMSYWIFN